MIKKLLPLILVATTQISGCAVNAVTGERNFQIYGTDWENEVGAQMYAPIAQVGIASVRPVSVPYAHGHQQRLVRITKPIINARFPHTLFLRFIRRLLTSQTGSDRYCEEAF